MLELYHAKLSRITVVASASIWKKRFYRRDKDNKKKQAMKTQSAVMRLIINQRR